MPYIQIYPLSVHSRATWDLQCVLQELGLSPVQIQFCNLIPLPRVTASKQYNSNELEYTENSIGFDV